MESELSGTPESINILNTPVHAVSMNQTVHLVHRYMVEPRVHQIATTNPEFVMKAQQDEHFRQVLQQADLCIPDGVGLLLASRWMGAPLAERVPGSELVYKLAELAAQEGWRLFMLGAGPGVAEEAARILRSKYPELKIAGAYAGSPDPSEDELIVQRINSSQANMLFVAYGAPNQDKWIARNRKTLPAIRLAIGVGGSLDFVTGQAKRAPRWIQNLGLEWLYRLIQEPWRWRRMLALPHFAIKVLLTPKP